MALVSTTSLELGFDAPKFNLPNTIDGNHVKLEDYEGKKGLVVMFICNHCPFVKHVFEGLVELGNDYISKGFGFVAISANDINNYPEDAPEKMKEVASRYNFPFPYLYDESQEVAKAYDAVCTPDFSIFDEDLKCVYRGQLDSSRPGNDIPVTGEDIRRALDHLIAGEELSEHQKPSIGCSIKWK